MLSEQGITSPLQSSQQCEVSESLVAEMDRLARLFRNVATQIGEMTDVDTNFDERKRLLFLRAGARICMRVWHGIAQRLDQHRADHGC